MKILLITHNPISTSNNMGKTFLSLFSDFDASELCQLYVHPTYPDVKICNSYYRITDKESLKSVYSFCVPGREVSPLKSEISQMGKLLKHKNSYMSRLGRDVIWKLSHWYSKNLKTWLDREAPTHIFLAPGYAKFIYDIALKISENYKIPIVTYICDDYYFVKTPKSLIGKLYLRLLQKKTRALMKKTSCLVAICDEIKELYCQSFGVSAVTIMTGTDVPRLRDKDRVPTSISYFGNVGCNRYLSLCEVGRALEKLNFHEKNAYTLKVYTNEQDSAILKTLLAVPTIHICDFVTGAAYHKSLEEAGLLLHVEAFDEKNVDLVKHSVSSKIADSLVSGIPLVAYGPAEIASIKYLYRHNCSFIATSYVALNTVLQQALTKKENRVRIVDNALRIANVYHDRMKNSAFLRSIFAESDKKEGLKPFKKEYDRLA